MVAVVVAGGVLAGVGLSSGPAVAAPADAGVIGWGSNMYGQRSIPDAATSEVTAISAGALHALALKRDGSVIGWGDNFFEQVTIPTAATSGVRAVAAGGYHSLALKQDGSVIGWGDNSEGQLPIPDAATSGVTAIAAGENYSLALKQDGSVVAWGNNTYGQTDVPGTAQSGVIAISAGEVHSLALKEDGSVIAWGWDNSGRTTVPAAATSGVIAISAGGAHSLALKEDGSVIGWGSDQHGQTTIPEAALSGVIAIAAGANESLALKQDGSVIGWGGASRNRIVPVPAAATSGVRAIAVGPGFALALKANPAAPSVTGSAPDAVAGAGYDTYAYPVTGVPTPTVALTSGALPPGLSLSEQGVLSGTPTAGGSYEFTLTATNPTGSAQVTDTVVIGQVPGAATVSSLSGGDAQALVSFIPGDAGYPSDTTYTVTATAVPAGSAPTLTSSAQPGQPGQPVTGLVNGVSYTFAVTSTNSTGSTTGPTSDPITVGVPASLTGSAPAGIVGTAYGPYAYQVAGSPAPTVSLASGGLPPGLSLSEQGVLSGTPTTAGTYQFTLTAKNAVGSAHVTNTVVVAPAATPNKADLVIKVTAPSSARNGQPYTYTMTVKNQGPATAKNVVTSLVVPAGTQVVSATSSPAQVGPALIWSTSNIANGATVTYTVTVKPTSKGTRTAFAVTGSLTTPDPAPTTNTTKTTTTIN